MNIVSIIAGVLFGIASIAALIRIVLGPTNIDRVVAADVLTATLISWLGTWMIINRSSELMAVLIALSLFAIVGTVSVSRFLSRAEEDSS